VALVRVESKSGGSRTGPNVLKERKSSYPRQECCYILSVAQLVTLLLPRLSLPGLNNRIFALNNCSYGTDKTWKRVFSVSYI
jgi:hypothetical protein